MAKISAKDLREVIERAAFKAASKALSEEQGRPRRSGHIPDYYRKTEALLRAYPEIKRIHDHPEEYQFFQVEHSHDIGKAPPKGATFREKEDLEGAYTERRKQSFVKTMTMYYSITAAIQAEAKRREFIAVAMYYLNQDEHGNDRGADAPRQTWEDISVTLEAIGIKASARTLSAWRRKIIREMAVLLFGVDGALSISRTYTPDELEPIEDLEDDQELFDLEGGEDE